MRSELITLEMNFPDGIGSRVFDLDDPLVAAIRRSVITGKPSGTWMYLTVRLGAKLPPKLLGTIAWTPGKRFLYFPGFRAAIETIPQDNALNDKPLDHTTRTLDSTGTRFDEHIAALGDGARARGRTRKGKVHRGHLHPRLSLLHADLGPYFDLPASFRLEVPIPQADVARRAVAMMGKVKKASIGFPQSRGPGPHYFQVDVWAGRGKGWKERYADALPWPTVDGVVDDHSGERVDRAAQWHELAPDTGVIVVLTRPSGTLRTKGLVHAKIDPRVWNS